MPRDCPPSRPWTRKFLVIVFTCNELTCEQYQYQDPKLFAPLPASSIPRAPPTPQYSQAPGVPQSPAYLTTANSNNPASNRSSIHTPPPPPRSAPPPFDSPAVAPGYSAPAVPPAYGSSSGQLGMGGAPANAEEEDEDLKRAIEESAREAARSALPPRPGAGADADSIGGRRGDRASRRVPFFGR